MSAQWYCKIGDRQYGPLEADSLGTMVQKGQLTPDSLVRRGEEGRWVAASQVQGLHFPGSSPELPKAKPLPPTPPPAPSVEPPVASVPVASAVALKSATPTPVTQAAASAYDPADLVDDEDKGLSKSAVVLIVAGFACVLLVTVGVVAGLHFFGNDESDDKAAVTSYDDEDEPADEPDPELVALKKEADSPPSRAGGTKAPAKKKDPLRGYKVQRWTDSPGQSIRGVASIMLSSVSFEDDGAALGGSDSKIGDDQILNERALGLDPTKTPNTNIGRPTREDNTASAAADQPNRIYIRVQVKNLAPDPMTYISFNGVADADAAMLADNNGNLCRLLPLAETPEATRIDQRLLEPGENVSDLLIFEAPTDEFESLRVIVPLTGVGKTDYLGFTITAQQLGLVEPTPEPAADDADGATAKKPSGGTGAPMREPDDEKTKDEKAAFEELQRSINAGNDQ